MSKITDRIKKRQEAQAERDAAEAEQIRIADEKAAKEARKAIAIICLALSRPRKKKWWQL